MKYLRYTLLVLLVLSFTIPQFANAERDKLKFIQHLRDEIAEKGYTFDVGPNPATDIALEDLCGLIIPPNWWKNAPARDLTLYKNLPSAKDWRNSGDVSTIKNQGSCGSCWAFATVGVLECKILVQGGSEQDLSEQYLVSCNDDGWGCNGGFFAHKYHVNDGAVYESCRPYTASDAACVCECSHPYRVTDWYYVSGSSSVPSPSEIKAAIYNYGPVGCAVYVDSMFQYYSGGVFNGTASGQPNHAVMLVGWDDNMGVNGCWILKNSWGTGWGENGFMYIAYGSQMVGYAANYITGYQSGNWPADSDCDETCNKGMTPNSEIINTLQRLNGAYPENGFVQFVNTFTRRYESELNDIFSQNRYAYHLVQRGLWTNLHTLQEFMKNRTLNGTLALDDFLKAIAFIRPLAGDTMQADVEKLRKMLEEANNRPVSATIH